MQEDGKVNEFMSQYDEKVFRNFTKLRPVLLANLPAITEEIDMPAKMIAYGYGRKYTELICVVIPSKKGLKLGFNRGINLPDPDKLLEGTAKISRYVEIRSEEQINSLPLKNLLQSALKAYEIRMTSMKNKTPKTASENLK